MAHDNTLYADSRTIALSPLTKHGLHLWKLVVGDTWHINRTYTGLQSGTTISKCYWTVKADPAAADGAAIFQVSVTSTSTAAGQIVDDTSNGGHIEVSVIATKTQTALITPGQTYHYDIQGIDSNNQVYTFEVGTLEAQQGVTSATT